MQVGDMKTWFKAIEPQGEESQMDQRLEIFSPTRYAPEMGNGLKVELMIDLASM